jgi:bacillithiol system protein YtxJ
MIKIVTKKEELEGNIFFIFKHSSTCPISSRADLVVDSIEFSVPVYKLIVQESRELSNQIAEEYGVKHESPQLILVKDGKAVWNKCHFDINENTVKKATEMAK